MAQHNVTQVLVATGRKPEAIQRFNAQWPLLRPDHPHYQAFLKLRAELLPGFRKSTSKPNKRKKRR